LGLEVNNLPVACFLTVATLSGRDADMGTDDGEKTSFQVQIDPLGLADQGTQVAPAARPDGAVTAVAGTAPSCAAFPASSTC